MPFRLQIQDISQKRLNSQTFFYTLSVANIRNQTQLCTLSGILFLWKKKLYPIRSTIIFSLHHLTLLFSEISTVVSEHSNVQFVQRFSSFLKRITPNIGCPLFVLPCHSFPRKSVGAANPFTAVCPASLFVLRKAPTRARSARVRRFSFFTFTSSPERGKELTNRPLSVKARSNFPSPVKC